MPKKTLKFPEEILVHFYDEGNDTEDPFLIAHDGVDNMKEVEHGTRVAIYKLVTERHLRRKTTLE